MSSRLCSELQISLGRERDGEEEEEKKVEEEEEERKERKGLILIQ